MKAALGICCAFFLSLPVFSQEIEGRNSVPVFITKEKTRIYVDSTYKYQFEAMDSTGDPLTYSVPVLPSWLSNSPTSRTLSGKSLRLGQYPIVITVSDGKGTSSQHFMLTVFDKETVNILAIGNSITNGTDKYNSYRRSLWKMLHDANYNFDFVGSWSKHHMGGEVPDPDFDMDHDGHSGWNCEHIFHPPDWDIQRGGVRQWLQEYTPDIVLIELGTNDVFQCRAADDVINNLGELVALLRTKNQHVKILLASILPLGAAWSDKKLCGDDQSYKERLRKMNVAIKSFVTEQDMKRSPVRLIDQFSGIDPKLHLYDDIHPNAQGEELIAKKWFSGMREFLKKIE